MARHQQNVVALNLTHNAAGRQGHLRRTDHAAQFVQRGHNLGIAARTRIFANQTQRRTAHNTAIRKRYALQLARSTYHGGCARYRSRYEVPYRETFAQFLRHRRHQLGHRSSHRQTGHRCTKGLRVSGKAIHALAKALKRTHHLAHIAKRVMRLRCGGYQNAILTQTIGLLLQSLDALVRILQVFAGHVLAKCAQTLQHTLYLAQCAYLLARFLNVLSHALQSTLRGKPGQVYPGARLGGRLQAFHIQQALLLFLICPDLLLSLLRCRYLTYQTLRQRLVARIGSIQLLLPYSYVVRKVAVTLRACLQRLIIPICPISPFRVSRNRCHCRNTYIRAQFLPAFIQPLVHYLLPLRNLFLLGYDARAFLSQVFQFLAVAIVLLAAQFGADQFLRSAVLP